MNLRWDPDGPGRGRVVLLHGVMSMAATWWRIGPALAARGWRVDALDLPGHGAWPRSARPLDLDILVDGIADQLPEPVDLLVGHSLGGAVAVALAGRRPDLARGLVLEDPPGARGDDRAEFAAGIAADARTVRSDRERLLRREREANPTWAPEDVEHSVDGIAAADAPSIVAGFHGQLEWDLPAMLAAVRVPVLLLAAGRPERSALKGQGREAVRAQLPPERFVVLDGGHCLHRDLPDQWLAAVTGFADDGSQPASGRRGQGLFGQLPDVVGPAYDGVAGDQGDLPFGDVAEVGEGPAGRAVGQEPAAGLDQLERLTAQLAADPVERQVDPAGGGPDLVVHPVRL